MITLELVWDRRDTDRVVFNYIGSIEETMLTFEVDIIYGTSTGAVEPHDVILAIVTHYYGTASENMTFDGRSSIAIPVTYDGGFLMGLLADFVTQLIRHRYRTDESIVFIENEEDSDDVS